MRRNYFRRGDRNDKNRIASLAALLDAATLGTRLRAGRETARVTLAQAAKALGREEDWLRQVEAGAAKISVGQIIDLSLLFNQDAGELIRGSATAAGSAAKFRVAGHKLEPRHEAELATTFSGVSSLLDLRRLLGEPSSRLGLARPTPLPTSWNRAREDGTGLAQDVREVLELGLKPLVAATHLVEGLGITVLEAELPSEVSGVSMNHGGEWHVILVPKREQSERIRFSVCHELAHHLVDDPREPTVSVWFGKRLDECRADAFAGELLLPAKAVEKWASERGKDVATLHFADLADLSVDFDVSYGCAAYRFFLAGWTDEAGYEALVAEESRGGGRRRATSVRLDKRGNAERVPGLRAQGLVHAKRALESELITEKRFAEYCRKFGFPTELILGDG